MSTKKSKQREWGAITKLPHQVKTEIEQYRRIAGDTLSRVDIPDQLRQQHIDTIRSKTAANIQRLQREAEAAFDSINAARYIS